MEGFTLIDGIAAAVVLISALLAYSRGFVRELLSIAGWIIAAIVAFIFAPQAYPLVKEIPILSDLIGNSCDLGMITAFAGVFAITLIVVAVFTPLFSGAVQRSALSGFDQGLGFLFGVARGVILIIAALFVYSLVTGTEGYDMVDNSKTKEIFTGQQEQVADLVNNGEAQNWFQQKYTELTGSCGG